MVEAPTKSSLNVQLDNHYDDLCFLVLELLKYLACVYSAAVKLLQGEADRTARQDLAAASLERRLERGRTTRTPGRTVVNEGHTVPPKSYAQRCNRRRPLCVIGYRGQRSGRRTRRSASVPSRMH